MESSKIFRNAVGGFHKDDVMNYIANLSSEIELLKEEKERECAALSEQLAQKTGQMEELERKLTDELGAARARAESLAKELEELRGQGASLSEEYLHCRAERERLAGELEAERTRAGKLERENRGLAERARQYDESTRQIADTIVKARVDADAITQNALKNADVIRKNVAEEIGGITSAVAALRRDYAEMRRSVEERMENLSAELQKGEESIGTMEAKFQVLAGNVSVEE